MYVFYTIKNVPANSVLLLNSPAEAINWPKGKITLAVSPVSGFIANIDFDPRLAEYSSRYEATQSYSPTFNAFHKQLAETLLARFDLRQKKIIEIGCDKGDFLTMLCELGQNEGVGFDPAYTPGRCPPPQAGRVTFIKDFYSEKYAGYEADFICCKMTLEHIPNTAEFLSVVRRSIGQRLDTAVFFQVPNAAYILRDLAFWDIYYEHCSYFTKSSLAHLFRATGFTVMDVWTEYDDQYLMIAARPAAAWPAAPPEAVSDAADILQAAANFAENTPRKIVEWRNFVQNAAGRGQKIVLWGGGSKGVAFLTTLGLGVETVEYVVDVNPHKTGTYMAGTGQKIVAPSFLAAYQPDVVIIMNPVYRREIGRDLARMGLNPVVKTVDETLCEAARQ